MATYTVFPSILPDGDEEFVDDSYSRAELEQKEYTELQQIAAEYDDVAGNAPHDDLLDALEGKERV